MTTARTATHASVAVLAGAVVVLFPRPVDVHESWVERPNPRWSCTGWEFSHYPAGVQDGETTTYCVGLERRIADG